MWFLPTRNRRSRCRDTLDSIVANGTSRGVVVQDGCDYGRFPVPAGWFLRRTPEHAELGGVLRWAFERFPAEPFYGFISDDMVVKTRGWALAMELAAGQWKIASSNDLWKGQQRMAGALCFGGELLRTLGYWVPAGMNHLYIDDVWETVGRELDCWIYRKDVVVEHLHFANGKGEKDDTYNRVRNGQAYAGEDQRIFEEWREHAEDDLAMVRAARDGAIRRSGQQYDPVRAEDGAGLGHHG